jgi:hypothetical protein
MLALINSVELPALRFAATFFLLINLAGGAYIFRNRHRFFDRDRTVDNDIPGNSSCEARDRHDSVARSDHASCHSADLFLERLRSMLNLSRRWRDHRLIVVVRSTFQIELPEKKPGFSEISAFKRLRKK